MAIALTKAGCDISAVYPRRGHPLAHTRVIRRRFIYSATRPIDSLAEAIRLTQPDLVVPCDDRAVMHLHALYDREKRRPGGGLFPIIERSLGTPDSYPVVSNRYRLLQLAREEGLPVPETRLADAPQPSGAPVLPLELPLVVKADGTWGGHGTKIVRDRALVDKYVRAMSRPLGAGRAMKRMLVDRDPFWMLPWREGSASQVITQSYIAGYPANCAVVSWNGTVLAGIAVEVVCSRGETGSATVVRVVDGPVMMQTATRIVSRLRLSGFLGFDFVVEPGSQTPFLIEMNPRVTPLCHLQLGGERDLVSALTAQLTRERSAPVQPRAPKTLVAYFPQAWHWDKSSEFLAASFRDVPWEEPELVRELLRLPWPDRSMPARLSAALRRWIAGETKTKPAVIERLPSVIPLREQGRKPPLFLIHGVDGQVNRFYSLIRHLEPDQPVYGILAQALVGRAVTLTRMEDLARYYLKAVREVQPEGPYHFLGFSFGGYVAFEAARQLRARGEQVGMLGMIDTLPMRPGSRAGDLDPIPDRNVDRPAVTPPGLAVHLRRIWQPGGLRYANSKARARALRMIYTALEWCRLPVPPPFRRAYHLNWFAAVRYTPQAFPVRITLFHTADSPARSRANCDFWADLTGREVELREIAGSHENLLDEPQVRSLAMQVTDCLAKTAPPVAQ